MTAGPRGAPLGQWEAGARRRPTMEGTEKPHLTFHHSSSFLLVRVRVQSSGLFWVVFNVSMFFIFYHSVAYFKCEL